MSGYGKDQSLFRRIIGNFSCFLFIMEEAHVEAGELEEGVLVFR